MAEPPKPAPFELEGAPALAGGEVGEGPPVVLLHGLTATRRYVVHGSVALARRGRRMVLYDGRGHGSSQPAPEGGGYSYERLTDDLRRVIEQRCRGERPALAGHSMGAHTAVALALSRSVERGALVQICPAFMGDPPSDEGLASWDALADGLGRAGVDGFIEAYDRGLDPDWRETVLRITRERLARHEHPEAVARALREVPRSMPFEGISELEFVDLPTLVVASRDESDPGHPYAIAEEWARRIPGAELISEDPGSSPLAWQGGRLSRAIAEFLDRAG
ncbi:MAG: alpha/beta fold hydrolase [Solirubrobacterales bacterium]